MKMLNAMVGSLLLAALPLAAQAQEMSYSYAEIGFAEIDIDAPEDGDGLALRGSFGITDDFFVFADYAMYEFDTGGGDIDLDLYTVGLGGHMEISDKVDLVGRLGYANADASGPGGGVPDDGGYLISAGLRGRVANNLELEGGVVHVDFGDDADDTALTVGGRYFFTENFAVGADVQLGDNIDTIFAGVRWAF